MQSKYKILVVGGTGYLGSSLLKHLPDDNITVEAANRDLIDLSQPISNTVRQYLDNGEFDYVVICAAIADIEKCFLQQQYSNQVNVDGTRELLRLIKQSAATPIFFSTDYVFGGTQHSYQENDPRKPNTIYGRQKLTIEQYLESEFQDFMIFRTSKLMSKCLHPKNILKPIFQSLSASQPIKCFEDQWINPVFVEDIAEVLRLAFQEQLHGSFHLGTNRIFTRAELARFLATSLGYNPDLIQSIRMTDIIFSEPKPTHNVLNCDKIQKALSFQFCELEDAVQDLQCLSS